MLRRFFQRLKHRIECVASEHMNFIDHVDLEACIGWCINSLLKQLRHFIDATVGCGVHFDVINEAAGINRGTGIAQATGMSRDIALPIGALTIQRLGQNT